MAILLVRHGETAGNVERVLQHADSPLNDRGLRQAERLAARLQARPVERVVSSDLLRARMTTAAVSARLGIEATWTPLLVERNFGDLRGKSYDVLTDNPFAPGFAPPGGEDWDAFHARVALAFAHVVALAAPLRGDLAVITHGLVCRAFAQRHLQLAAGLMLPGRFSNTGLTVFDVAAPHRVELLDCTEHLSGDDAAGGPSAGAA